MPILRLLASDWLKTKRTAVRWLILAVPVLYASFLLWYFSSFRPGEELQLRIYNVFFELTAVLLPLWIAVISGFLSLQEEHAGQFCGILSVPLPRPHIYLGKLLLLLLAVAFGTFAATALLVLGMRFGLQIPNIQAGLFFSGALLTFAGALFLIGLHLMLGLALGLGASVGAGGAGFLMAGIIGATNVGDAIWPFVPWAWPVRLSVIPAVHLPGFQASDTSAFEWTAARQAAAGLLPALVSFAAVVAIGVIWFHKWEGRKHQE
ncbi:lantibiotic immunity ABC transporter MutG family permease subunit [Cohnella sp.]|uniref:lantibiotic immunity ABC transporter MutG family permease subunit n=1 Tax=Cohnella sp. TaxID=1883426 RepID=UPI00257EEEF6|nr:lantibiotic immunity ABC transporter MutG family permease subunit [Cohnella sp.]